MKILLFDIDGTLMNAGQAPRRAFNRAFEEQLGVRPVEGKVVIHGATDPEIRHNTALATLGRRLRADEYSRLNARYLELLKREIAVETEYRVMPGVKELLSSLAKREDVLLGLQTGNLERAVAVKLGRAGLESYFTFGGFGTDSDERSEIIRIAISRAALDLGIPSIKPAAVTIIGDSPQDIQAGHNAGVRTIAVATGIYPKELLAAENPACLFSDLTDQKTFLSSVGLV